MPSLRELQQRFADAVLAADGAAPALSPSPDAGVGAERLGDLSRARCAPNYRNALGATYPVVRRLVGAPFFDAAVDAFVARILRAPATSTTMATTFGDFLGGYAPASESALSPRRRAPRMGDRRGEPRGGFDHRARRSVLSALAACPAERAACACACGSTPSCRLIASPLPAAAHLAGEPARPRRRHAGGLRGGARPIAGAARACRRRARAHRRRRLRVAFGAIGGARSGRGDRSGAARRRGVRSRCRAAPVHRRRHDHRDPRCSRDRYAAARSD